MPVEVADNREKIQKAIKALLKNRVFVGITQETSNRSDGGDVTNAQLGYIHENGSPVRNIPARPFLVPGIQSVQPEIERRLRAIGKLALTGKVDDIENAQMDLGQMAVNAVQVKITEGPFVPLKPSTIAARKRRGRTGTMKPLIDTGTLRRSITYVLRKAK